MGPVWLMSTTYCIAMKFCADDIPGIMMQNTEASASDYAEAGCHLVTFSLLWCCELLPSFLSFR